MVYLFDGSLEGLFTSVFEWFERKPGTVSLVLDVNHQPDAFTTAFNVHTEREKADRVLKGLQKRLDHLWLRKLYCCYLSEIPEAFNHISSFAVMFFKIKSA